MNVRSKNIALILGTTIGAGIFSLPIALKQSGSFYFILLLVFLSILLAKVNLLYREIIDEVSEKHQLPGYVKKILGEGWGQIAVFLLLFSTFGALLAYLIIGGNFFATATGFSPEKGTIVFYAVVGLALLIASKYIEALDVFFTILKIVLLGTIITISVSSLNIADIFAVPFIGKDILPVYGAVLFSVTGFSIMPELKRDNSHFKQSIYTAQLIVFSVYLLFAVGLSPKLQNGLFIFDSPLTSFIFNVAGVLTVTSPYLLLSQIAYDLFIRDLKLHRALSVTIVLLVPFLLYILGVHSFLSVISVTGGVFLGGIGILIARMYIKKFPGKQTTVIYFIQAIFFIGILLELLQLLR